MVKAIFSFLHVYLLLIMVFEIKDFVANSSEFDVGVGVGVSEEAMKRGKSSYLSFLSFRHFLDIDTSLTNIQLVLDTSLSLIVQ